MDADKIRAALSRIYAVQYDDTWIYAMNEMSDRVNTIFAESMQEIREEISKPDPWKLKYEALLEEIEDRKQDARWEAKEG